jgi:hypothetical protein
MSVDREKYLTRHRRYNVSERGLARSRRYHETHPYVSMFGMRFRMPNRSSPSSHAGCAMIGTRRRDGGRGARENA